MTLGRSVKKIPLATLLMLFVYNGICQHAVIDRYTSEQGLSFNYVFDVLQDDKGFIWCSTHAGLNRFDGVTFTHYFFDPKSENSPSGNRGSELYEDKNGYIWYVTQASGVNRYDPETNAFKRYTYPIPGSGATSRIGYTFAEDKQGALYMLSEDGLCYYNEKDESIELFRTEKGDSIFLTEANVLFFNSENKLFIGAQGGVYTVNLKSGVTELLAGTNDLNEDTYDIKEDSRGHLFIATWGGGILDYDLKTKTYKRYCGGKPMFDNEYRIFNDLEIYKPNGKELVVASTSNTSLMTIDPLTGALRYYDLSTVMNDDESHVISNNITIDKANNIWIGTSGGLMKIDPLRQLFTTIGIDPSIKEEWYTDVSAIYQDTNDSTGNTIWYSVPQNGIFITALNNGTLTKVPLPADINDDAFISQITRKNEHELLFAGNRGLMVYNETTRTWTRYRHNDEDEHSLSGNFTSKIVVDNNGRIWVATHGYGMNLYKPECDCFERITVSKSKLYDVYLSDNINDITLGADGSIWVARGYQTGFITGVSKLNTETLDQVHFFKNKKTFPDFPLERDVFSVLEDDSGYVWIASEQGVLRFDPQASTKDKRYVQFTLSARMPSDASFGLEQHGQNIWVVTDAGIAIIDKIKLEMVRTYQSSDGLISNFPSALVPGFDSRLFIGGPMGFQYLSFEHIQPNKIAPPVYITSLKVLDSEYYEDGRSILAYDHIRLPYDENKLTISFTALNFTNAADNRFKYMLKGFDDEWIYTSERTLHFNNLPPGHYVFKVIGSNDNGVWNELGDELYITITPPWYKTTVFYIACLLLVSGILYGVYRIRVAQILRIERLRNKISSDLHDDVGSSLSSINMLSALAKKQAQRDPEHTEQLMLRINTTTQHTIENMSDIVWAINPKNDKLSNFLVRMQEYLADTLEVLGITYTCNIEERLLHQALPMDVRRDFFLIFKEAVNNAAKYSHATHLNISVSGKGKLLLMTISDNGRGFDPSTKNSGNGLTNMRSRAARIGGNVSIESSPGKGCSVILTLPLH